MKVIESRLEDGEEWGMANVGPKRTGLPGSIVVFVNMKQGSHGPCIKVSNIRGHMAPTDTFSVSVDDDPQVVAGRPKGLSSQELQAIRSWIVKNKQVLLDYWNAGQTNMETEDLYRRLEPL